MPTIKYPTFEYCRFTTAPRQLMAEPLAIRARFEARASASGGHLFGVWRSVVGLGLARDEGIALTAWAGAAEARQAPPEPGAERHFLTASVRPLDDAPPAYSGVYVFRWFDIQASDWETFRDLSDAAWPNMESVFDANICGFWRSLDVAAPAARVLLLTRYADLSVWEASRWWKNPVPEADASMARFARRNDLIDATVAYPALPILPGVA